MKQFNPYSILDWILIIGALVGVVLYLVGELKRKPILVYYGIVIMFFDMMVINSTKVHLF